MKFETKEPFVDRCYSKESPPSLIRAMSLPPIQPDKTAAGIAVDPRTLERVVPETRRPDGSCVSV
jgi:hypothetical protein